MSPSARPATALSGCHSSDQDPEDAVQKHSRLRDSDKSSQEKPGTSTSEQKNDHVVEDIVDKKTIGPDQHYLVKRVGRLEPRWEPAESLSGCQMRLVEFDKREAVEQVAGPGHLQADQGDQNPTNDATEESRPKPKKKRFKVERGAEVIEILASAFYTTRDGSQIVLAQVKYHDETTEVLPTMVLAEHCPLTLIDYYEGNIVPCE